MVKSRHKQISNEEDRKIFKELLRHLRGRIRIKREITDRNYKELEIKELQVL